MRGGLCGECRSDREGGSANPGCRRVGSGRRSVAWIRAFAVEESHEILPKDPKQDARPLRAMDKVSQKRSGTQPYGRNETSSSAANGTPHGN